MYRFLILLCSLVPVLGIAQEQDSLSPHTRTPIIRYKTTALSLPYRMVRDEGHTPLLHRGTTIQIAAYNERFRKKSVTKLEFLLNFGILKTNKNKVSAVTSATALYMEVNYHYMRPVLKLFHGKGDWYVGGIFTNTFDGRLYSFLPNNSFGYEFSNALNPATHLTYNFTFGPRQRAYQAGFKMDMALLAHVIRPNFIGMEPSETYMGDQINALAVFTKGNRLALPHQYFRINTTLYLDRHVLGSPHKYRFFYAWGLHVTKIPQSNPLYTAYHSLGVASMIYTEKFKKVKAPKSIR
jgi:hypothetical protein